MSIDEQRGHEHEPEKPEEPGQDQAEQGAESYGGDPDAEAGATAQDTEQVSKPEPTEG
jgi:hypothetical protein